jgi:hypothetical protein
VVQDIVLERIKGLLTIRDAAFVALLYLFLMVAVILSVIVLVIYYFLGAIPAIPCTGVQGQANWSCPVFNTTQSQINALASAGTNLFTVALIIVAAAGVIAAVGLIYMGRRGGGGEM